MEQVLGAPGHTSNKKLLVTVVFHMFFWHMAHQPLDHWTSQGKKDTMIGCFAACVRMQPIRHHVVIQPSRNRSAQHALRLTKKTADSQDRTVCSKRLTGPWSQQRMCSVVRSSPRLIWWVKAATLAGEPLGDYS